MTTPPSSPPPSTRTLRATGRRPPGPIGGRIANLRERFRDFPGFLARLNREFGDIVSYQLRAEDSVSCSMPT